MWYTMSNVRLAIFEWCDWRTACAHRYQIRSTRATHTFHSAKSLNWLVCFTWFGVSFDFELNHWSQITVFDMCLIGAIVSIQSTQWSVVISQRLRCHSIRSRNRSRVKMSWKIMIVKNGAAKIGRQLRVLRQMNEKYIKNNSQLRMVCMRLIGAFFSLLP